ncbi:MAG: nitroreductase family protein [Cellvibrio sp.]|jgi:Nitroreductase
MTIAVTRIADHDIDPVFLKRWSPRAFADELIDDSTLFRLFEAARWAPSGNNSQPWRFIYTRRDSDDWADFYSLLNEKNQRWAAKAAALVVLISKTTHVRQGAAEATPLRNHSLDAGAAWASLAFQAEHLGWSTHAIGGFNREKARQLLVIPGGFHIEIAIAIGKRAAGDTLPEEFRAREQPSLRLPLSELVAQGKFSFVS